MFSEPSLFICVSVYSTIQSDESVSGTCDQTYFNPGNLTLASSGQDAENTVKKLFLFFCFKFFSWCVFRVSSQGSPGGGRRRRSLRSKLLPRTRRNVRITRQEQEDVESVERTVVSKGLLSHYSE